LTKLRVALGDLRHSSIGRHSVFMPIGIGFIGAYLLSHSPKDKIDLRLYDDPETLLTDIDKWEPDVIGLSNYCWNSNISCLVHRYAKKQKPGTITISGGPDFPLGVYNCLNYLKERPEIDYYAYREGEIAFSNLVNRILKKENLKDVVHDGVMSLSTKGELLVGNPIPRLKSLDEIPSPYLTGLMDQYFNGEYAPCLEFVRGCPFTCGYCYAGQDWCSPIARFSIDRIKADLDYIAARMKIYSNVLLAICDSNFGMYAEDEEIADHISRLQDNYGWPNAFDVTSGKANYDRIIRSSEKLKNKMRVACSVQSMNPETLDVIKRYNMPIAKYKELITEIRKNKMLSAVGLIIPMPLESKETFFRGIRLLFESGVESFVIYTTMLLNATYLSHDDCRNKYSYQTRFRIIPRQFGRYKSEACYEIEEVCITTNTMSFEDYLDCRGFAFLTSLLSNEQFDIIRMHLKELNIPNYDYLYSLWKSVASGNTAISELYKEYIEETKDELFQSREDIYEFFTIPENYEKLLKGDLGDNLLRKYITKILLNQCDSSLSLAYFVLQGIAEHTEEEVMALKESRLWVLATRNVSAVFRGELIKEEIKMHYDLNAWYNAGSEKPLISYKKNTKYNICYNGERIQNILDEAKKLYGQDFSYVVGKILINWSIKNFWAESNEIINK
jgi:radical SAM superfamily enzyme YgiQ (UPF0313 family)